MSFVLEIIQPISKRFIKSNVFQELFTFRRGTTLFHLSCCKFKRACLLLRESLCGLHVFSTVGKRAFPYSRNVVNLNNSDEEEGMKLDNISLARPSPVVKVLLLGKWWDRVKWVFEALGTEQPPPPPPRLSLKPLFVAQDYLRRFSEKYSRGDTWVNFCRGMCCWPLRAPTH